MKLKYSALLAFFVAPLSQAVLFINEIHYDNVGGDVGEAIEIAGTAGTDLSGMSLVLYNGNNGASYGTVALSGIIADQQSGFGTLSFSYSGIQNGSPDGLALVDSSNNVVQFLSYEGSFTAADGPATGMLSEDIGVVESSTTPSGYSLQLGGIAGSNYADFTWQSEDYATPGAVNNNQSFGDAEVRDTAPEVSSINPQESASNVAIDAMISVTFSEDVVVSAWNDVQCSMSGAISVTASGEGRSYTLDPDADFIGGEHCSFTINAADVSDLDGTADNLVEDVSVSFTIVDLNASIDLVINEFQSDPAGDISGDANGDGIRDSAQDEFVEIVNPTNADIDISGWTLSDGVSVRHVFPANSVIEAGCAAVVFGGGIPSGLFGGALIQTASSGGIGLNNGGDTIAISNGAISIDLAFGAEASTDQSLTRNPDITGEFFSTHSSISQANGALFSPGTQIDGSKFAGCTIPDIAPTVIEFSPADGESEVTVTPTLSFSFSEEVVLSVWPSLSCSLSGDVALSGNLTGTNLTAIPEIELANSEVCSITLAANSVSDIDGVTDNMASDLTISFTTEELLVCSDDAVVYISAVQGTSAESSYIDQPVKLKAVVTAVFPDLEAFFMQEEASDEDGNSASSEGIFVYNEGNRFTSPVVGDVVLVKGTVAEFYTRTQINLGRSPLACGAGAVVATALTLPFASSDAAEALEGMLVSTSQVLTVSDNYSLGGYGEVTLSNGRLFNPTNLYPAGSQEGIDLAANNVLNRVLLDDGMNGSNPAEVIYPAGGLSAANSLRTGDSVSALTGILDYGFSEYRVIPTAMPTFVATNARTAEPEVMLGNVKVASLNVLNFFTTLDLPGVSPDPRGADSALEFERQKAKTLAAIIAINADILGLMEIENNGTGAGSALDELVSGLNAQLGEGTYAAVESGSAVGTDLITTALIYKTAKVTLNGNVMINNESIFNRPPIAQTFALNENGETLTVVVNHFKSKGCGSASGLDADQNDGQGCYNAKRVAQAEALATWLRDDPTLSQESRQLIIGDLNSYAKEAPILTLEADGFTNLIENFQGAEAYSYAFGGTVGYLDHALASAALLAVAVDANDWHINADEPTVLDYNTEDKTEAQIAAFYAPDQYRMSDHDPVVMTFQLETTEMTGDWDGDGDVDVNDIRAFTIAIQKRLPIDIAFDLNNDGVVNALDTRAMKALCTRAGCAA